MWNARVSSALVAVLLPEACCWAAARFPVRR